MRSRLLLHALAITLVATSAAPAFGETVTCSDAAHVSWRADETFTLIHGAVVSVPGCDSGEAVGLQVLTTDGDVPSDPLLASAEDDKAMFDLEPYGLRIEPAIGVRVFLNGRPVAVEEDENDDGSSGVDDEDGPEGDDGHVSPEGEADGDTDSTPPPAGGVGGVHTERPALPPTVAGGVGDRPDAQPAPAPSAGREGSPFTLATTGTSVATLLALAVVALLLGALLRRYRRRDT